MRRLPPIILTILLALSIGLASADTLYVLCRPEDYVNVRAFPSTKANTVGQLDCGDSVESDGESKRDKQGRKWIKVYGFESGEAWICAMYLQETPVQIVKCTGYVVANGRTALRRSPNGKRIKWLKNGVEINIIAMSEEWVLTRQGYVSRECLDVTY